LRANRVLNVFSYPGALSLTCAHYGATSVVSVDTAEGVLAWSRKNFELAGHKPGKQYRFELGDALRFVARAVKDKEQYDLILIDPPTASPARGDKGWNLTRDYPALIAKAAAITAPGGLLWLASNTQGLSSLTKIAGKSIASEGRDAALLSTGGLGVDYPTVPVQVSDRSCQTAVSGLV